MAALTYIEGTNYMSIKEARAVMTSNIKKRLVQ